MVMNIKYTLKKTGLKQIEVKMCITHKNSNKNGRNLI